MVCTRFHGHTHMDVCVHASVRACLSVWERAWMWVRMFVVFCTLLFSFECISFFCYNECSEWHFSLKKETKQKVLILNILHGKLSPSILATVEYYNIMVCNGKGHKQHHLGKENELMAESERRWAWNFDSRRRNCNLYLHPLSIN